MANTNRSCDAWNEKRNIETEKIFKGTRYMNNGRSAWTGAAKKEISQSDARRNAR